MKTEEKPFFLSRREFVRRTAASLAVSGLARATAQSVTNPDGEHGETQAGRAPFRVIVDTDPGVDDALALLLAMRSPELKIEGITPVAGNVPLELTLPNALRMVEIAGRTDIPVAAGAKTPLVRRLVTAAYAHGENGLAGAVFPEPKINPVTDPAASFIGRIVRKYPHEVTLITIGPLTNVATTLAADPELAHIIPRLVMMGGSLSGGNITPAAEFNMYVDPEAARIVFQSGIPITMVGLDVTRKTFLTEAHVRALESGRSSVSQAAAKIARSVLKYHQAQGVLADVHMHDPLAVAAFLDPSILKWQNYYVDIETAGELTAGETVGYSASLGDSQQQESEKQVALKKPVRGSAPTLASTRTSPVLRDKSVPNAWVAVDVDSTRFFDLLIGRLSGKE